MNFLILLRVKPWPDTGCARHREEASRQRLTMLDKAVVARGYLVPAPWISRCILLKHLIARA